MSIHLHMYVSTLNTFVNLLALGATALQNSTNSDLCSFFARVFEVWKWNPHLFWVHVHP